MAIENNEERREQSAEQPKKKKITAVFHAQNSAHNSLKSRPGSGSAGARKPQGSGARPAGSRPAGAAHSSS